MRGERIQFLQVSVGQPIQDLSPMRCHLQTNPATVVGIDLAPQQIVFFTTVYQLHHAVVFQSECFRSVRNGRKHRRRRACHSQQELMLLRVQTGLARRIFAGLQELPQLMPKLRQCPVQGLVWILFGGSGIHDSIISDHDIISPKQFIR